MALYYADKKDEDGDPIRIDRGDIVTILDGNDFHEKEGIVLRTRGGLVDVEVAVEQRTGDKLFDVTCSPESLELVN